MSQTLLSEIQKSTAFSLLRRLVRQAHNIPSYNHQRVALHKIRTMYEDSIKDGPEKFDENVMMGEIYFDTLEAQVAHLQRMKETGLLVESFDWQERRKKMRERSKVSSADLKEGGDKTHVHTEHCRH